MGYNTEFEGSFEFEEKLTSEMIQYINRFSTTRRMKRDVEKIKEIHSDWKKFSFNGDLGEDGEYFVGDSKWILDWKSKNDIDPSIIDYDEPPAKQPGLWCKWMISLDGKYLKWDGNEKFYNYIKWLEYLINHFFTPNKIFMNGNVVWRGDDFDDMGKITVEHNKITVIKLQLDE
ncbi:hypothetical protein [Filifactor alocis]|uniref:hypothetical protein n=1 Tax=Filifactor alocis TaxID=143361 RepID=UPI003FA0098A